MKYDSQEKELVLSAENGSFFFRNLIKKGNFLFNLLSGSQLPTQEEVLNNVLLFFCDVFDQSKLSPQDSDIDQLFKDLKYLLVDFENQEKTRVKLSEVFIKSLLSTDLPTSSQTKGLSTRTQLLVAIYLIVAFPSLDLKEVNNSIISQLLMNFPTHTFPQLLKQLEKVLIGPGFSKYEFKQQFCRILNSITVNCLKKEDFSNLMVSMAVSEFDVSGVEYFKKVFDKENFEGLELLLEVSKRHKNVDNVLKKVLQLCPKNKSFFFFSELFFFFA